MALIAGHVANFGGSMAEAIEQAFQSEWTAAKTTALPQTGVVDRKILFAAVAQGVLNYLEAHKSDLVTSNKNDTASGHSHILVLDINVS
jgi:hypothetical protein